MYTTGHHKTVRDYRHPDTDSTWWEPNRFQRPHRSAKVLYLPNKVLTPVQV